MDIVDIVLEVEHIEVQVLHGDYLLRVSDVVLEAGV